MPLSAAFSVLTLVASLSEVEVSQDALHVTLIDVDQNFRIEEWSTSSEGLPPDSKLGSSPPWRVQKDVLHGGRQEGVDRVRIDNGVLSFTILPSRGMNLWEARCGDLRLGWDSPVKEVVHPHHVNLSEREGLGWLEGFAEWINRCGLASNGAAGEDRVRSNTGSIIPVKLSLHGKISYIPARKVEIVVDRGEKPVIRVRGVVDETMMYGTQLRLVTEISTEAGSKSITIHDEIQNLAATEQEFQILYHANFGPPLLEEGAVLLAPAVRVTPRDARAAEGSIMNWNQYGPPITGYLEQVYFIKPASAANGKTEALLRNKAGDRGVSVVFSTQELPYLTLWKNTAAKENGYVTGIEPATNYPNNRSFERKNGRVPTLKGGQSFHATITITAHVDSKGVSTAQARIAILQGSAEPKLDAEPVAGLCP
jgi:hypothetical protein